MTSARAIPRVSAIFACIWGLWVVNPWGDVFSRNPVMYRPMLSLVPYPAFWGAIVLIGGLVAEMLTVIGRISLACLVIATTFFSFAVLYFMADVGSPAFALWGWLALYNFAIFWERRGEWKAGISRRG